VVKGVGEGEEERGRGVGADERGEVKRKVRWAWGLEREGKRGEEGGDRMGGGWGRRRKGEGGE